MNRSKSRLIVLCLGFVLTVALLLGISLLSASALGPTMGSCGPGLQWTFNESTGELNIHPTAVINDRYTYEMDDYSSSSINNTPPWREYHSYAITSVVIEEGVTSIGNYAFYYLPNLESVTIAESVKSIGDAAFGYCRSLEEIDLPNKLESLGASAFFYCESLKEVSVPDTVGEILESWFYSCYELERVSLPTGITQIPYGFFHDCRSLTYTIPNTVTHIESAAFFGCESLTYVNLPEGLTYLGDESFARCTGLQSFHIPSTVTEIGWQIIRGSDNIRTLTVAGGNPVYASTGNCVLTRKDSYVIFGCSGSDLAEATGVKGIADYAFDSCIGLTEITIPASVEYLGEWAFAYCEELAKVTILASIDTIPRSCFTSCYALTSLTVPDKVTTIKDSAFNACTSLESVYIPASVTYIEQNAFGNCYNLSSVTLELPLRWYCKAPWYDEYELAEFDPYDPADVAADLRSSSLVYIRKDPPPAGTITGASMLLGESITMKYYAYLDENTIDAVMRFTFKNSVYHSDGFFDPESGEYGFYFNWIAPQCLNDEIKAELLLIAEDGTETLLDVVESYSVRQYCDDALADDPYNDYLVYLLADLLNYGAAAQEYVNYKTDDLCNRGFEAMPTVWEDLEETDFSITLSPYQDTRLYSVGMKFDYCNYLYFKFKAEDINRVTVLINGTEYDQDFFHTEDGVTYILYTYNLFAYEFDDIFTVELCLDGDVIQTLTYSVKSYVYSMQDSHSQTMAALAKALYRYGISAYNYYYYGW